MSKTFTARVLCRICGRELAKKPGVIAQDAERLGKEAMSRVEFVCPEPGHLYNLNARTVFEAEPDRPDAPVAGWGEPARVPAPPGDMPPAAPALDPNDPDVVPDAAAPGGFRKKTNGIAGHAVPAPAAAVAPKASAPEISAEGSVLTPEEIAEALGKDSQPEMKPS